VDCLDKMIRKVLVNCLATRFCVKPTVARKFLPEAVEQWGKLRQEATQRRLGGGGDLSRAAR